MRTPLEQLGRTAGWLAAPGVAAVAAMRRARVFHPVGVTLGGVIESAAAPDDLDPLAAALPGRVVIRFSGALWKRRHPHLPDVLGCALRILDSPEHPQDLLFATIRRPWTVGLAPLTTHTDDYLANHYFGISPFALEGVAQRFYLRLRPLRPGAVGGDRRERLMKALEEGPVDISIDASYRPRGPWRDVAILRIEASEAKDDPRLRFDPFRTGRGIEPRGMIHELRRGSYAASQATRRVFERAPR